MFDLDDVLCEFNVSLCQALADVTGDDSILTDYKFWDRFEIADKYPTVDFEEVLHKMEREGYMATIPVIPEARHLCNVFYTLGHEIVILTARGWMDDGVSVSSKWLATNDVMFDRLIVSGHRASKKYYMPPNTIMYFDDNAQHIIDCAPLVIQSYLVDRPWNASLYELPDCVRRIDPETMSQYAAAVDELQAHVDQLPNKHDKYKQLS